jgi:hypothetical protein
VNGGHGGNGGGPLRPHRFEPARLVLGLALIVIAILYVVRVTGEEEPPLPVMIGMVPGALVLAAVVAGVTHAVRRARGGRAGGAGDGP